MPFTQRPISTLRRPPPTTTTNTDSSRDDDGAGAEQTATNNLPQLFSNFLSLQAETVSTCVSALSSPPLLPLLPFGPEKPAEHATSDVVGPEGGGGALLLRKIGVGLLAAAYVGVILTILLVAAAVLGVAAVRVWVEEPVLLRERLNFDYTDAHPNALFSFESQGYNSNFLAKNKKIGVPVGHTFYVSLVLVMPESDYNREIGIFQVAVELISSNGGIMTRSSHPCMLHFRSQPIRLMREMIWGIPLLLGITAETQRIAIPMIRHKEGHPRTEAIRVILMPRAGTLALPQVYEAEIVLKSHLPWMKEILYRWEWTLYVWATLYIYMALLVVSLCCFRPLIIPAMTANLRGHDEESSMLETEEKGREGRNESEALKRRRLSRSRRKEIMRERAMADPEQVDSSASSYTINRDDTSPPREDTEDSESVCFED